MTTRDFEQFEELRKILVSMNENLTKVADLSGKLVVLAEKNVKATEQVEMSVRRLRGAVD